jgi:hypothetical protein
LKAQSDDEKVNRRGAVVIGRGADLRREKISRAADAKIAGPTDDLSGARS